MCRGMPRRVICPHRCMAIPNSTPVWTTSRTASVLPFTGGPILTQLEGVYSAAMARPLYCSVDPLLYAPEARDWTYDLGYMGTYSADRRAALKGLLLEPAQHWPQGCFV